MRTIKPEEIKEGRYLLEHRPWSSTKRLVELTVIEISEMAVKVMHITGNISWIKKAEFCTEYELIEVLPITPPKQ